MKDFIFKVKLQGGGRDGNMDKEVLGTFSYYYNMFLEKII